MTIKCVKCKYTTERDLKSIHLNEVEIDDVVDYLSDDDMAISLDSIMSQSELDSIMSQSELKVIASIVDDEIAKLEEKEMRRMLVEGVYNKMTNYSKTKLKRMVSAKIKEIKKLKENKMKIEIPDLEVMVPVVKERRRLQTVRSFHISRKIIDGNQTDDGYTWRNVTDEEVSSLPLHRLWHEYETSQLVPSTKEDFANCIIALGSYVDIDTDYTYDSLINSSIECLYSTYVTLRASATMLGEVPSWRELVKENESGQQPS